MISSKLKQIAAEQAGVFDKINEAEAGAFIDKILGANAIYCAGVGRSGYIIRAFAMRLMHSGLRAFVIGDTEAPAAKNGDLLILGSGSGKTESLKAYAAKAKKLGMELAVVTSFPDSTLGHLADVVLRIPAPTPKAATNDLVSIQPMANLFEQSMFTVLDAVIMETAEKMGLNADDMFARHANLE